MDEAELFLEIEKAANLVLEGKTRDARQIYERLSQEGSTDAKIQLGYLLLKGKGSEKDVSRAEILFREAAGDGSKLGKYYLGLLFQEIERFTDAFREIRELAETGYLPAVNRLGWFYEDGIGCEKDLRAARHYRSHAATHGHFVAQRWLAEQMALGRDGFFLIPLGLVNYLQSVAKIFWFSLKYPNDPRVQG